MDGNGRWATSKGKQRFFGHVKGAQVAKDIIEACARMEIPHLTLYTFSAENWARPFQEVSFLMELLRRYLVKEMPQLFKNNIRFKCIGDLEKLPIKTREIVEDTIAKTANHTGLQLNFAISYGGQQEIIAASKRLFADLSAKNVEIESITPAVFEKYLSTYPTPNPDLLIRTGGEFRTSNFLTWQIAYTELFFSKKFWPDFTVDDLKQAIDFYQSRERRFGKTSGQLSEDNLNSIQ